VAGKQNHHHPPYHLTPHPLSLVYHGRGGCNPTAPLSTSCSTTAARNRATPTRFRFFWPKPTPRLALRERTTPPPPQPHTHHHTTPTHHPSSPFYTGHPYRATTAQFRLLAQTPSLTSCFTSAQPHHHHRLIHTTTPPLLTVPPRRFTRCTRN
jgi:hypothetical protein